MKWGLIGAAALVCLLASTQAAPALQLRVSTAEGVVEGARAARGVTVFRGIPYAKPPIGTMRWRAPAEPASWTGVRSARVFAPYCMQNVPPADAPQHVDEPGQSEDCLYLNVWSPAKTNKDKLPVMVWIHGGGFYIGSGGQTWFDGKEFARKGVVLVTINYRLDVFGFLVHPELSAESVHGTSGNYGLLDQIAALKWIKKNIAAFGGDPGRVTIFGESAGSTSVSYLQASPLARGLFQRAIGESTSQMDASAGIIGYQSQALAEASGLEYAASVGAPSIAALRQMPADKLLKTGRSFWPLNPDGYVVPDELYKIFAAGQQNDVPILLGWNAAEGNNLRVPWVKPEGKDEEAKFERLYAGAPNGQIYTDTVSWQMQSWGRLQRRTGKSNVYLYRFEHNPPPSKTLPPGPAHAAEIAYVFQSFDRILQAWTRTDRHVGRLMADYWVNFARTGDPNGPGLPRWPALDLAVPQVMALGVAPRAIPAPREEAFQAIDAYYAKRRAERARSTGAGPGILNINLSGNGPDEAASVPDIAVDPRDPSHIVAVWRTIGMRTADNSVRPLTCHMAVSNDGGNSFSSKAIDWNMPDVPICNAPYVDFGAHGELFIGASLVAKGPLNPPAGYHAFGNAVIRKSADGGSTWAPTISAIASDSLAKGKFAPNPSIPEAAMLTPWDGARGIVNRSTGDIYVAGGYPAPPGGDAHSQRFYSISHDGAKTWSAIRAMGSAQWPQRWDGRIIAAPGKMAFAYIAGAAPGVEKCLCVVFATSTDGVALARTLVTQVKHVDTLVHYPPVAADPTANGLAIALASDDRTALSIFTTSDGGSSWNPVSVPGGAGVAQVSRPAIAYTPAGALIAMWRGQHGDGSYDVYMAAAPDGAHFRHPVRVTAASSRIPEGLATDYAVRGDFINVLRISGDSAHAVWTDWRTGREAVVYYGRVPLRSLQETDAGAAAAAGMPRQDR